MSSLSNQSPQQQLPPYDPMASSRPIENTPRMRELAQNKEPNQSPLRKELELNLSKYREDVLHAVDFAFVTFLKRDECIDNLLDVLIHALPEEKQERYHTPEGDIVFDEHVGFNRGIEKVKQLLLEAKGTK